MRIDEAALTSPRRSVTFYPNGVVGPLMFALIFAGSVAAGLSMEPRSVAASVAGASLIWLLLAWLSLSVTRVEVDEARCAFEVLTLRWPLSPKVRSFPLDAVRDAVVRKRAHSRGAPSYVLALILTGEEAAVPLCMSRDDESQHRIAERIQVLLGQRGDAKGSWE